MAQAAQDRTDALYAIASALRRGRTCYCVSLRDLAEKIGVSASLLSRIENAQEKPSERVLKVYAEEFRMGLDEMLAITGRIPDDVVQHLVNNPEAVQRVRAEMKDK